MFDFNYYDIALLAGLFVCFIVQLVYYLNYLSKPMNYIKHGGTDVASNIKPAVSIIICAQNESQNLANFLPSILEQDYPTYEVIVVNDGSTDESAEVLGALESKYKHLYCTYIPDQAKYLSRKKLAVTIGAKAAKNDILLFTEANCEPLSNDWISRMVQHFDPQTGVVLGFSAFSKSSGFFRKLASYDNLFGGLQYLSMALLNRPYMGVGRNLAYRKELFFSHKGFSKHLNLQAGEDDLFINEIVTSDNTKVELSKESLTTTHIESLKFWREMKVRHATTQRYYKSGPVAFWRIESFSRVAFYALVVASIIYGFWGLTLPIVAGTLLLLRFIAQAYVINKSAKSLNVERFYFTLLLFDLLQPLFNLVFYVYRIFRGKIDYTWR